MAVISIKVVPGSKKNRVVGKYGDAIKVQVSAPPEGGKANQAVIALLVEALGVRPQQISITRGHTQPRKTVQIEGLDQSSAEQRLLNPGRNIATDGHR
jgi:uncharacterized protein (TIGR00251 family)